MQIIIGLGMMLGAGASSYISKLLGKGDNEQADRTASTTLFSGLLVGAVIIIGILIFLDPVMIYGMDLGIEGAAVATVISLCIIMALYIGYIAKRKAY